jgi:SAM-dependent methyltransferase
MDSLADSWIAELQPSRLVRRFASQIVNGSLGKPILDIACGSGRNALVFSQLGCAVTCVDRDLTSLRNEQNRLGNSMFSKAAAQLSLYQMDLAKDPWPFSEGSVGAIVNVHFLFPPLFRFFESSLAPGGYLLLETVPGHGGNYLQLPKIGELRSALENAFNFEFYRERRVGPRPLDKVTVQLLARRRSEPGTEKPTS